LGSYSVGECLRVMLDGRHSDIARQSQYVSADHHHHLQSYYIYSSGTQVSGTAAHEETRYLVELVFWNVRRRRTLTVSRYAYEALESATEPGADAERCSIRTASTALKLSFVLLVQLSVPVKSLCFPLQCNERLQWSRHLHPSLGQLQAVPISSYSLLYLLSCGLWPDSRRS
jgi:hypothetical protein